MSKQKTAPPNSVSVALPQSSDRRDQSGGWEEWLSPRTLWGREMGERPEHSPHPGLALLQSGAPFSNAGPAGSKGAAALLHDSPVRFFCYLPFSLMSQFWSSVSPHLTRASLPPARASPSASRSRACMAGSPDSRSRELPAPPSPSLASPHPLALRPASVSPAAPVCGDAPDTSGSRPPGRPPCTGSGSVRVPAPRPPLTACFREPGWPVAAAMMAPSRDGGTAPKPRPSILPPPWSRRAVGKG